MSGRIVDLAVDPERPHRYFVAVASGGVWKTDNAGTTWTPVFDDEGSYSIGCVALDPKNPNVVWVGTGENNSQRSVGYGDGVYKSRDGGKDVDERRPEEVRAHRQDRHRPARLGRRLRRGAGAAVGRRAATAACTRRPTAARRGTKVLDDQREHRRHRRRASTRAIPDVLVAAAYQRRRHVWTLINGGPESAHPPQSTDGGKTWTKVTDGLPDGELGRIGLAIVADRPRRRLRHRRGGRRSKGGIFRSHRRRRDVGEARNHVRPAGAVLRRARRRPDERRPRLRR